MTQEPKNEISNETQNGNNVKADVIKRKWLALSDEEKFIMGRPNFACGKIAHRMRDMGFEVARKAEEEQALVIYTMLQFYNECGKDWMQEMEMFLKNEQ